MPRRLPSRASAWHPCAPWQPCAQQKAAKARCRGAHLPRRAGERQRLGPRFSQRKSIFLSLLGMPVMPCHAQSGWRKAETNIIIISYGCSRARAREGSSSSTYHRCHNYEHIWPGSSAFASWTSSCKKKSFQDCAKCPLAEHPAWRGETCTRTHMHSGAGVTVAMRPS